MDKIRIVQIGTEDWNDLYELPDNVRVIFMSDEIIEQEKIVEIVVLQRNITEEEFELVKNMSMSYCFFVTDTFSMDTTTTRLFNQRMGKVLPISKVQEFLLNDTKKFFPEPYGEKFEMSKIGLAQGIKGKIVWHGNNSVSIKGNFGNELTQIAFWKNNIPLMENQALDIWLEYKKTEEVEISLVIKQIEKGSLSKEINSWEFSEEELAEPVRIEGNNGSGSIFCYLRAKGTGQLSIIALHDRISRWGAGEFMVGGERYVTSDREEIFAYFDPGDMKPPLAVYFSGYKTMEGFEGYYLMRKMGCPFLLIAEQRFEGGGFYQGNKDFESLMVEVIEKYMSKLGFYPDQLILSGISMGTIGAMFYGSILQPHALILGKPLASLGDIAENERLKRPKGFPTSLDLLRHFGGGMDEESIEKLNERFWDRIRKADFSRTKVIASYMIEDDYDSTAYTKLLSELNSSGVQIYGKGLHGRHNDNTAGIVAWFKGQYERVLKEDFDRVL